jgi:hypothetical protein
MVILLVAISDHFRVIYHRLLVVINDYLINDYWCLFLVILDYIMTIGGYYIFNYCWIF